MTPTHPAAEDPTRLRLLEAASAVFAEQGYRAATVREICQRAGANVAAVNYHFGGKEGLYGALLGHLGREAIERHPPDLGVGPDAGVEERLFAFVHSFLLRILSDDGVGCIVAREMMEPTGALDRLVDEVVRPLFGRLRLIVAELRPGASEDEVVLCARSVVGQCLFYRHARPVWQRLSPDERATPERIREIAAHVTRFSLEGIGYARAAAAPVDAAARARAARSRKPARGPGAKRKPAPRRKR